MEEKNLVKVDELTPASKNADMTVKVLSLTDRKTIDSKFGGSRELVEATVGDETGTVILTLWGEQIEGVAEDDVLEIDNGYVSLVRGHMRLNVGKYGSFKKSDQEIAEVKMSVDKSAGNLPSVARNKAQELSSVEQNWEDLEGVRFRRERPPIVSAPEEIPSRTDTLLELSASSMQAASANLIVMAALAGLTPAFPTEALMTALMETPEEELLPRVRRWFRDRFSGVRVIGSLEQETVNLILAEVHRPKVDGCSVEFTQTYTHEADYTFSISVFGLNGGRGMKQEIAFDDKIKTKGDCLQLRVPVTIAWEECKNRLGEVFPRGNIVYIAPDYDPEPLRDDADGCGFNPEEVRHLGFLERPIKVPSRATRRRTLSFSKSETTEFGLKIALPGVPVSLGPQTTVSLQRDVRFRYILKGPGTANGPNVYVPLRPQNRLTYYWSWQVRAP